MGVANAAISIVLLLIQELDAQFLHNEQNISGWMTLAFESKA
jgi:hypothetical protein